MACGGISHHADTGTVEVFEESPVDIRRGLRLNNEGVEHNVAARVRGWKRETLLVTGEEPETRVGVLENDCGVM